MEDRYWLRHPSLRGHLGPYEKKDLHTALDAAAFPRDSYVLPDAGETEDQRNARPDWRPVTQVLGLDPPPEPPPRPVTPPAKPPTNEDRRDHVRTKTAYTNLRFLISVSMGILVIAELIAMSMLMSVSQRSGYNGIPFVTGLISVLVTIVVGKVFQAVLDIADCSLSKQPHPRDVQ